MALTSCSECGQPISKYAKSCPHCGDPYVQGNPGCLIALIIYLLAAIGMGLQALGNFLIEKLSLFFSMVL